MTKLALRRCTPVKKGSKPISPGIARSLLNQINNKWHLDAQARFVERDFEFEDFRRTIEFVNAIAWIVNGQDHHPDLEITYNRCKVRFSTHTAGGLTVNDFICAAKIDALFSEEKLKSASPPPAKRPHPAAPAATHHSASVTSQESATQDSVQLSGLSLDSDEVEELLNTKLPDEEEEPTTQDTADEFELLDPETISPPPEPPSPAPQPAAPAATATEKPAIVEEPSAAPGMTSTVILPPGMQAVGEDDEDEDATVILPENTAIDPEETLVGAGNNAPNLPPASPRDVEDDDEVKTVILNPTLAAKPEDETVIRPAADSPAPRKPDDSKPAPSSRSVSLPPLNPKTDDDEVGTMILSSNPFNHPSLKTPGAATGTDKPQEADKQNTAGEKRAEAPKPPADEEPDHMGTMILSPAEIEALNRKQAASSQKTDDDDTLVMHVNDFKKLKKDQ